MPPSSEEIHNLNSEIMKLSIRVEMLNEKFDSNFNNVSDRIERHKEDNLRSHTLITNMLEKIHNLMFIGTDSDPMGLNAKVSQHEEFISQAKSSRNRVIDIIKETCIVALLGFIAVKVGIR